MPRDRIARPPRRASTCRSTPELPRQFGAGGGTCTPDDSRSAAARLRYSATPAWFGEEVSNLHSAGSKPAGLPVRPSPNAVEKACTGTRLRTWSLRVQSATCYRFHHPCARGTGEVAVTHRHPFPWIRARIRTRARDWRARAHTRASARNHLRFQLRYSRCERAGAIVHQRSIGCDSRYRAIKKAWCRQALDVGEEVGCY